jgi:ABC transporter substrate binding protein
VRFMALAIFLTGDLLRECAFSSRTSAFDQERRLARLPCLFAISHLLDPLDIFILLRFARRRLLAPEGPSLAFLGLKLLLLLEWDAGPVLVTIRQGQPDLRHVR